MAKLGRQLPVHRGSLHCQHHRRSSSGTREGADGRESIRVSGGGRNNSYSASFSGSPVITNPEQIIVKTPLLNRIWAHNDGSNRVTAEGGATLKELDVVLHQNRLSILTSTAPNFISVAGAVAL